MPKVRLFQYIFLCLVSFIFPFVSINATQHPQTPQQPTDLGISLLDASPALPQPEDLIPNFNYAQFYEQNNDFNYKVAAYDFGIYAMVQTEDDIFFGISPGLPAMVNGALVAKYDGTNIVPIKMCEASGVCKNGLTEQGVHDMSFEHGALFIPGSDPLESWEKGEIYTYKPSDGFLKKHRNMPFVIHSWGSYYDGNNVYVATGSYIDGTRVGNNATYVGQVFKSADLGETWATPVTVNNYRVRDIIGLGDRLYAVSAGASGNDCWSNLVYSEDKGATWEISQMPYSTGIQCYPRLYVWNNKLLYMGFQRTGTDLIAVNEDGSNTIYYLPFATAIQQNIFTTDKDGFLYAISQNAVYRTKNLTEWQLVYQDPTLEFTSLLYWEKINSIVVSAWPLPKLGTSYPDGGPPPQDPEITEPTYYDYASKYKVIKLAVDTIPCNANFSASQETGSMPLKVSFAGQVTPISGSNQKWSWDFNGDGVTDSTDQNPDFTYNSSGEYNVSLRVEQATNSCFLSKSNFIKVTQFEKITTGDVVTDTANSYGVSCVDYNNDNLPDIFVANGGNLERQQNFLYKNEGNFNFSKITDSEITNDLKGHFSASWADYDNNGTMDLYVGNYLIGDGNSFFSQQNDGSFVKTSLGAEIDVLDFSLEGAWSDVNNDGNLDIFIYGRKEQVYLNDGNGKFIPLADNTISGNSNGGDSGIWGDINNDGFQDLFIPRILWATNALYKNNGNKTFSKMSSDVVVPSYSWSASFGDYNNDGFIDLLHPTYADKTNKMAVISLYKNDGSGNLRYVREISGGDLPIDNTSARSSLFADFDNDGYLDMFVTTGTTSNINNIYYRNNGDGTFKKVLGEPMLKAAPPSWGSCTADFDNDGDLDLFIATTDKGAPNLLYKNNTNSNWLKIKLVGMASNKNAIGAKVFVTADISGEEVMQLREITSIQGLGSQSDYVAHFGLGDATKIKSLKVLWPSGKVTEMGQTSANQQLDITEKIDEPICGSVKFDPISGQENGKKGYYRLETNYVLDPAMSLDKVVFTITKKDDPNPPQILTCPSATDINCEVDTVNKKVIYNNFLISTAGSYKAEAKITQK